MRRAALNPRPGRVSPGRMSSSGGWSDEAWQGAPFLVEEVGQGEAAARGDLADEAQDGAGAVEPDALPGALPRRPGRTARCRGWWRGDAGASARRWRRRSLRARHRRTGPTSAGPGPFRGRRGGRAASACPTMRAAAAAPIIADWARWDRTERGTGVALVSEVGTTSAYQEPFGARRGPVRAARPWLTRCAAPSMPRICARAKTCVMRALMRASRGRPRST